MPKHPDHEGRFSRMANAFAEKIQGQRYMDSKMLTKQEAQVYITRLQTIYSHLGEVTNLPQAMIYPAGGFDIYPLLFMESLEELAIIDAMPFAREQADASRRDLRKIPGISYKSKLRRNVLGIADGQSVSLDDLKKNFSEDEQVTFDDYLRIVAKHDLKEQSTRGFHLFPSSYAITSRDDQVEHILGALHVAAVDLNTVSIGKFGEDFHVTFTLNNKEKRIIYREKYVEKDLAKQNEAVHAVEDLKERFSHVRSTGYIKADVFDFADLVILGVRPDSVIITPRSRMEGSTGMLKGVYTLSHIPDAPSAIRDISLGYGKYGTYKDIMIGELKK